MMSLPPEAEDPIESFESGLPDVQIWCFQLLDFQTGHFSDFEQFKVDSHSADLRQVEINWNHFL